MQSFVSIGFRHTHPVANPLGLGTINVCNQRINIPALPFFRLICFGFKHNPYGQQVVDFIETDIPSLHFQPDRIHTLRTGGDGIFVVVLAQTFTYRLDKFFKECRKLFLVSFDLFIDNLIFFGMFVFHTEVFELGFDGM